MLVFVLKGISLLLGMLFVGYVLTSQIARRHIGRRDGDGWFLATVLLMATMNVLFWPLQHLLQKESAWWARGWWRLFLFALLGVCLLLVSWFL